MQLLYVAIILLLATATLTFALQNLEIVNLDFLWIRLNAPLTFVVAATYVAGMVTGSSFLVLMHGSVQSTGMSRFTSLILALIVTILVALAVIAGWNPFG
jgi:hypothetical protein